MGGRRGPRAVIGVREAGCRLRVGARREDQREDAGERMVRVGSREDVRRRAAERRRGDDDGAGVEVRAVQWGRRRRREARAGCGSAGRGAER
jgi:hypothetical protein